ncbi:MAG: FAD-dependent oxidoreductase [Kiritimatiellia bacterium]
MNAETNTLNYMIKLKKRFLVAEKTLALQFEKPKKFVFKPGQYIDLTLLHPSETDEEGNIRTFSIASAPHEEFLMVATRLRESAFKRQLPDLALGTELKIEGPSGGFTLHNNPERAALFLVGGIGITPVRSILMRAAKDKLPHRIVVLYANRRPEDAAFLDELTSLQKENPNYTLIPTMNEMDNSTRSWSGETEKIGPALLKKYQSGLPTPLYYVVGPPGMVNGVHAMLNQTGIDDDDIRSEDFGGY